MATVLFGRKLISRDLHVEGDQNEEYLTKDRGAPSPPGKSKVITDLS